MISNRQWPDAFGNCGIRFLLGCLFALLFPAVICRLPVAPLESTTVSLNVKCVQMDARIRTGPKIIQISGQ